MKRLNARPAVAVLTFVLGVALASVYLLLPSRKKEVSPPCQTVEVEAKPAREEATPEPLPEWLVKVGELPEHDGEEAGEFSVTFVDESVGWLVNGAKLWRTEDGGARWELVYSKGKASRVDPEHIDEFRFTSPEEGWMLVNNILYRTRDGGRTWAPRSLPKVDGYFGALDFLPGGKVGWVAGSVCGPLGKGEVAANRFYCSASAETAQFAAVYMTRDGGRTWRRQRVSRRTGNIHYLRMKSERSGLAVGQAGAFRYEGGRWLQSEPHLPHEEADEWMPGENCLNIAIGLPTYCPFNFQFDDERHGWLSNSNGYLCRTDDGGKTWTDITRCPEEEQHLDPPYFVNFRIGRDGSGLALDTDGSLQKTRDGGVTWERLTEPGTFECLFALDEERLWLLGEGGVYRLKPSAERP